VIKKFVLSHIIQNNQCCILPQTTKHSLHENPPHNTTQTMCNVVATQKESKHKHTALLRNWKPLSTDTKHSLEQSQDRKIFSSYQLDTDYSVNCVQI